MKNLIKIGLGLVLMGSLTSCIAYTDGGYGGNYPYNDA